MSMHRRPFSQLLAAFGVSAATPALAQAKTVDVSMAQSPKMRFIPEQVARGMDRGDVAQQHACAG